LVKNPLFPFSWLSQSPTVKLAFSRIMERISSTDGRKRQSDFLDHYLNEKALDETIDIGRVMGWLLTNVRFWVLYHLISSSDPRDRIVNHLISSFNSFRQPC
jgi:hypothetical protein